MDYAEKNTIEVIVQLTSKKYSRADPINRKAIEATIYNNIRNSTSTELFGLWGGTKYGNCFKAEKECIKHIESLADKTKPYCKISLIFCDLHHIVANGVDVEAAEGYYKNMLDIINEKFDLIKLSRIMLSHCNIDSLYKALILMKEDCFERLITKKAEKHSEFSKYGAVAYVAMEIYFLDFIYKQHKNIFFSFSDPRTQKLIAESADVPMLFFNVAGREHHDLPWYT